jgi:hypothetical protein
MKKLKLHEIIAHIKEGKNAVLYELIHPYRKMLWIYFSHEYNSDDLILVVSSVTNALQYVLIASSENFSCIIDDYVGDAEDAEEQKELMNFNAQIFNPCTE